MEPRQLDSRLLTKLAIRAMFGEISHVFHVAAGESFHVGKGGFEVVCDPRDDFGSPAVMSLAVEDFPSNAVVQMD